MMSKIIYLAGVIIALMATVSTGNAQNKKENSSRQTNGNRSAVENITDLTTAQQDQIRQLENGYRLVMGDLRTQLQNVTAATEKSALQSEMQQMTQSHQNSVKRVLNPSQQKEYTKMLAENRPANSTQGKGKGQGKGSGGMRGGGQGKRY